MKKILLLLTIMASFASCKMNDAEAAKKADALFLSNKEGFEKIDVDLQKGEFKNISETAAHFSAQNADYLMSENEKALATLDEIKAKDPSVDQQKIREYLKILKEEYYPTFKTYLENSDDATLAKLAIIKEKISVLENEISPDKK